MRVKLQSEALSPFRS